MYKQYTNKIHVQFSHRQYFILLELPAKDNRLWISVCGCLETWAHTLQVFLCVSSNCSVSGQSVHCSDIMSEDFKKISWSTGIFLLESRFSSDLHCGQSSWRGPETASSHSSFCSQRCCRRILALIMTGAIQPSTSQTRATSEVSAHLVSTSTLINFVTNKLNRLLWNSILHLTCLYTHLSRRWNAWTD